LIIAVSAALALLSALVVIGWRFPNYLRSKQLENEVAVARIVQSNLLPSVGPRFDDLDFAAECSPAWEVGGDFYDAFNVSDRRAAFMLGDVSGKGISAAVLMGFIHGAAHASAWTESPQEHVEATARLNNLLYKKTSSERFVSLCWGYFDRAASVLHYVNAGHLPPLLFRLEKSGVHATRLDDGGPVLGLIPDVPYRAGAAHIEENDLLVIFSDGVVETAMRSGEEFGEARLIEAVRAHWHGSAHDIREAILRELYGFTGEHEPQDDRTLIVLRFQHSKKQQRVEELAFS
jgi:sigma-B regulation protein RsbU (phosphoserine phosphatase)